MAGRDVLDATSTIILNSHNASNHPRSGKGEYGEMTVGEIKHCPGCGRFMKYVYDHGYKYNLPEDYYEIYWICKCGVVVDVFP